MRCGCENGGDCTSISVCAAESMVEDTVEELQRKYDALVDGLDVLISDMETGALFRRAQGVVNTLRALLEDDDE